MNRTVKVVNTVHKFRVESYFIASMFIFYYYYNKLEKHCKLCSCMHIYMVISVVYVICMFDMHVFVQFNVLSKFFGMKAKMCIENVQSIVRRGLERRRKEVNEIIFQKQHILFYIMRIPINNCSVF